MEVSSGKLAAKDSSIDLSVLRGNTAFKFSTLAMANFCAHSSTSRLTIRTVSQPIVVERHNYGSRACMFSTGTFITAWGEKGKRGEPGHFNLACSVCVDGQGRILVGDADRVQCFAFEE